MGYSGSRKITQDDLAYIVGAIEGDISDDIRALVQDDLDKTTAGELSNRIDANAARVTALEPRVDSLAEVVGGHFRDWSEVKSLVRAGNGAAAFKIGEQFETEWTDNAPSTPVTYTAAQNVCHVSDGEIFSDDGGKTEVRSPGMFLQWHYATPYDMPFDAREALYSAPEGGLAAGTYYFKVTGLVSAWASYTKNNGKTFMFTLTDNLPEGAKLKLSAADNTADWVGANVYVIDDAYAPLRNHDYGEDGYMPLSEWDGESGLPLTGNAEAYTTGANGLNHIQRVMLGCNRWSQSVIRQWLNSAASARVLGDEENYPGWWHPQNEFDCIPSQAITYTNVYVEPATTNVGKPGFLSGYSADFIAAMRPVKVVTAANTVTDGGVTDVTYDKVFLPSLTQMNIAPQVTEGTVWDYYKQLFAANPVSGRTNWAQGGTYAVLKSFGINAKSVAAYVRLRSAARGYACFAWGFYATGAVINGYGSASTANRQRPACVIG